MVERQRPLYLARASYRRRRLIDAIRVLPILMFVLWLLPLLWGDGFGVRSLIFVFAVWVLGTLVSLFLSAGLLGGDPGASDPAPPSGEG